MFDIGMSEMVVIGVVALIVVGPKDLPQMFRQVGQFVGKARGMARDFQRAMEQAADGTGVNDIAADLKKVTSMKNLGLDEATKSFQNYQKSFEPEKVDAAAEKARRDAAVADANAAAAKWPPEGVPVVENSEVVEEGTGTKTPAAKPATKAAAVKKPAAKKAATKKPAALKTAAKKPAAAKAPAKAPAKSATKAAPKKAAAKKPAAKKPTKAAETKT
nr:Sec-independent protein translocase protein TatB [Amylibacter sp.]